MKTTFKKILVFSSNKNKIKEIKKIFIGKKIKFLSIDKSVMPAETGKTFNQNAKLKSKRGFDLYKIPCISDDSGICVSALKGGPGVFSKRFEKKFKSQNHANQEIIKLTKKLQDNKAYFKSVISFTYKKNKTITFEGIRNGIIVSKPRGKRGFGYDPIFQPNGVKKTYAEMSKNEKNSISHRSIAMNKFFIFLNQLT